jgi:hypothetical protein
MLLRRKPLRSTVNGSPFAEKTRVKDTRLGERARRTRRMRSRAESPRDDKVSGFRGRLYGMTVIDCFFRDSSIYIAVT